MVIGRYATVAGTFVPFVAGMGRMRYARFFAYNVIGAILWVVICVGAGFFFGIGVHSITSAGSAPPAVFRTLQGRSERPR